MNAKFMSKLTIIRTQIVNATKNNNIINITTNINNTNSHVRRSHDNNDNNNNKMMEERYYESIIFSGPIIFALIILFLIYFIYLRRHSVDWSSLRMRHSNVAVSIDLVSEVGLNKEFRDLLPIIVYKESFSVNDTQCSVCLGDYQAEERLQQIPGCGHTFHLSCIDHWLATHTTCPLCRLSLISPSKDPPASCPGHPSETDDRVNNTQNLDGVLLQTRLQVF